MGQIISVFLSDLVPRECIWDNLDDASQVHLCSCSGRYSLIGEHGEVKADFCENFLEKADDLKSQTVLSNIVKSLKYTRYLF